MNFTSLKRISTDVNCSLRATNCVFPVSQTSKQEGLNCINILKT